MGRPAYDWTGKQINNWTVIKRLGSENICGQIQPIWLCRCACGHEQTLPSSRLRQKPIECLNCSVKRKTENYVDITGQKFNSLIVIEYSHSNRGSWWKCFCDCGEEVIASVSDLRAGRVKSCKTCKYKRHSISVTIDETGNVYGQLTVIKYIESRNGESIWLCRCSCGNTSEVRGSHLRSGSVQRCKDCGIKHAAIAKTTHGLSKTKFYRRAMCRRRERRKSKLDKNWTGEMEHQLRTLFGSCVLCGITEKEHQEKYEQSLHVDHVRPLKNGNGLDYGNATILCAECNRKKHAKTLDQLDKRDRDRILITADLFDLLYNKNRSIEVQTNG